MKWTPSLSPPWVESAVLEVSDDLFGSDHEDMSDTQSPRLSKEGWPEAKRIIRNSGNPPVSKEAWDEAMHIVQDIKTHSHAWGNFVRNSRPKFHRLYPTIWELGSPPHTIRTDQIGTSTFGSTLCKSTHR